MERPGKDKRGSLEQWEAQLDTTPDTIPYHTIPGGRVSYMASVERHTLVSWG